MPSNFAFLTDCGSSSSGAGRYGVYLDPAQRIVYTRAGDGQPLEIARGLHLDLGWVPACTVGESLRNWLEDHEAHLGRIVGGFSTKGDPGWTARAMLAAGKSVRGGWTREALKSADDLRASLQQALRDRVIASYWKISEWWAPLRPHELAQQALAARSLDAFVGAEVQRARTAKAWIDYDEALECLRQVLRDRRHRLESGLAAMDHLTWSGAATEHYRLDRTLGDPRPLDEPAWDPGSHSAMVALQRRIMSAVDSVDPDTVMRARMTVRSMDRDQALDPITMYAALAAATVDSAVWDAIAQIRQAVIMEEQD